MRLPPFPAAMALLSARRQFLFYRERYRYRYSAEYRLGTAARQFESAAAMNIGGPNASNARGWLLRNRPQGGRAGAARGPEHLAPHSSGHGGESDLDASSRGRGG